MGRRGTATDLARRSQPRFRTRSMQSPGTVSRTLFAGLLLGDHAAGLTAPLIDPAFANLYFDIWRGDAATDPVAAPEVDRLLAGLFDAARRKVRAWEAAHAR